MCYRCAYMGSILVWIHQLPTTVGMLNTTLVNARITWYNDKDAILTYLKATFSPQQKNAIVQKKSKYI